MLSLTLISRNMVHIISYILNGWKSSCCITNMKQRHPVSKIKFRIYFMSSTHFVSNIRHQHQCNLQILVFFWNQKKWVRLLTFSKVYNRSSQYKPSWSSSINLFFREILRYRPFHHEFSSLFDFRWNKQMISNSMRDG